MANSRLYFTLVGTFVGAVALLQLISVLHGSSESPVFKVQAKWDDRSSNYVADDSIFLLGAGKADITGPVVEVGFGGYADLDQIGTGLRQRIYSRAFVVGNPNNLDETWIYIILDTLTGDTGIRHGVLEGLGNLGGEYARYSDRNIALTGTHSHSGPGAWYNYLLPQIPNKGFSKQSYNAIVDGVLLSIQRAHESLAPGRITFGTIDVENANINRSPYAYDANPEEEKSRYSSNVDKTLNLLRFDRESDNKTSAVLTFFPVHGTSLYGNNTLVTGDNKGIAAWLFERSVKDDEQFTDGFVAGFSQSSVGDTSPNTLGAWCEDGSGEECNYTDSTCGGKAESCHGRGPFFQENDQGAKSAFEIGRLQYSAARELHSQLDSDAVQIRRSSQVGSFHLFHNMEGFTFQSPWDSSTTLRTCAAGLGFSFAAGTTDWPGYFDFTQNDTTPAEKNPLWYIVRAFLHAPTPEQKRCQEPKDVLLDVGEIDLPYAWSPNIIDVQLLRVGQLFFIVSTSEVTTMAGRRWKEAIANAAEEVLSVSDPLVVLGSPANSYSHYVTTAEEYAVQRYEGASTLYGPNTLAAFINLTLTNLPYLSDSAHEEGQYPPPNGVEPPINTDKSLSFIPSVVYDGRPLGRTYGAVIKSAGNAQYAPGDVVTATFVGANPRNNLRLEKTFAAVERQTDTGNWETVRTDSDYNLVYRWKRTSTILGHSEATLEWEIENDFYSIGSSRPPVSGTYRFHYYGDAKAINGQIEAFEGVDTPFTVSV
ncbi:Neutral/alkaline nonlysosomal ceramidase [Aspergillus karnatakaensis]|uniref:neutral/alkaline ceramidase n=1 Tax=Aspergillus karnatakaensis TaxID=1810916 RepID=UPI003CCD7F88